MRFTILWGAVALVSVAAQANDAERKRQEEVDALHLFMQSDEMQAAYSKLAIKGSNEAVAEGDKAERGPTFEDRLWQYTSRTGFLYYTEPPPRWLAEAVHTLAMASLITQGYDPSQLKDKPHTTGNKAAMKGANEAVAEGDKAAYDYAKLTGNNEFVADGDKAKHAGSNEAVAQGDKAERAPTFEDRLWQYTSRTGFLYYTEPPPRWLAEAVHTLAMASLVTQGYDPAQLKNKPHATGNKAEAVLEADGQTVGEAHKLRGVKKR